METKGLYELFDNCVSVILAALFAVFGGAARAALSQRKPRTLWEFSMSLVVAGFAGVVTYNVLRAYGFNNDLTAAAAGMAGLLGDDLLSAVLSVGAKIRKNPEVVLDWWKKGEEKGVLRHGKAEKNS